MKGLPFSELHSKVVETVEHCLFRSWLDPENESFLAVNDHKEINLEFSWLEKNRIDSINGFLTRGSTRPDYHSLVVASGPEVSAEATRISLIVSSYLAESALRFSVRRKKGTKSAKEMDRYEAKSIAMFDSPYAIAQWILTDPEAIETREIARFHSKLALLKRFGLSIDQQSVGDQVKNREVVFSDLDNLYRTLQRYVVGRDNYSKKSDPKAQFLLSFSSSMGILTNRLEVASVELQAKSKEEAENEFSRKSLRWYSSDFDTFRNEFLENVEFAKAKGIETLPTLAEVANRVFGIPIALSGFTELLKGGLKQGAGEGTVSLIRGEAGAGKTTLAVSIQRAVEALGIPTLFVTSEETIAAVEARRESSLSLAQKGHSEFTSDRGLHRILRAPSASFLEPPESNDENLSGAKDSPLFQVLDGIIEGIKEREFWPDGATQFTKLFVVFDGVHNFIRDEEIEHDYFVLQTFVERCRDTGVQVLLTSSNDWMLEEGFEYLVDNFFILSSKIVEEPVPHADRKFQVIKTRHQGSMVGIHRMAITDEGSLQFQPNFSELLKWQSRRSRWTPGEEKFSHPFKEGPPEKYFGSSFNDLQGVRQYQQCSTLLYGVGSSSKADIALRILSSPIDEEVPRENRILVISFLATADYYENCVRGHNRRIENLGFESGKASLDTIFFPPGMIAPEEVYYEISQRLDHTGTTLNSYDGVLVDGIHNVFVQFPRLMGKPELWTALIGLFKRSALASVLTYSDFDIAPATLLDSTAFSRDRATPLMVSLTQTLDYGYNIVPSYIAEQERQRRKGSQKAFSYLPGSFELSCFIAHKQQISGDEHLIWDKVKKTFSTQNDGL